MYALSIFDQLVELIEQQLGDINAQTVVGRNAQSAHGQRRRITWVTAGGQIEAATTSAVYPPTDGDKTALENRTARAQATTRVSPLYSKKLVVAARIQAESFASLETLHDNVLIAARAALGSGCVPGRFEYLTQQDEASGRTLRSEVVVQTFEWDLVVPKSIKTLVPLSEQEHECSIDTTLGD